MNKVKLISVGADVEMFLKNRKTGEVVSSEGIIQGSKYDPFCFDKDNHHYTTSLDNILTEITFPPATNVEEFVQFLNKSLGYVQEFIPKELEIHISPSESLDEKYLMTEQAQVFGCESDFNAHTKRVNCSPNASDPFLRSAGGHLHCGYEGIETEYDGILFNYEPDPQRCEIVKVLDLFVGIPSVIMEPDNKRKELYGKAGAYRPKEYGLEYRTPSNFYLASEELKAWAYNSVVNAFEFINENGFLTPKLAKAIQRTINNNDKQSANALIQDFNLQLV